MEVKYISKKKSFLKAVKRKVKEDGMTDVWHFVNKAFMGLNRLLKQTCDS